MELKERERFLTILQERFSGIIAGEGHCVFVSGEAGIGKSSLVKAFRKTLVSSYPVYQGTCDALFTPRPLAPLYDIIPQMGGDVQADGTDVADRAGLFARVLHEL